MNHELFSQQTQALSQHIEALEQHALAATVPMPDMFFEALDDLRAALEELRATETELREQNERLARVEQGLMTEQRRYQELFEFAPEGYLVTDAQQVITEANRAAAEMLNRTPEYLVGLPLPIFVAEESRQGFRHKLMELRGTEQAKEWEVRLHPHQGQPLDAALSATAIRDTGRRLTGWHWLIRDLSEQKQAETKIREQAALLDQTQDAILLQTVEGRVLYWNKGAERVFGYSAAEAVGHNVQDLIYHHAPELLEQAHDSLLRSESETWLDEARPLTKDGRTLVVERRWTLLRDPAGQPQSVLVNMTDITEKKQIEEQYLRAQRLDSIGALAAGLAHDLNNIFAPLLMASNLLKKECHDESALRHLNLVINNIKRGCSMVKHVLGFASGAEGESIWFQPKHVIEEVLDLLAGIVPEEIELKKHIPANLWLIYGDSTKLHQALVNLCINARDAMPEGGLLQIRAENLEVDATYAQMMPAATPGCYVRLSVIDTGTGMAPEVAKRIFDPFFTSKEAGKGTGLGLATVKAIMSDFRGFLTVSSKPGDGSEFSLFFPATSATENQTGEEQEIEPRAGQGELILIASREASLREIIGETLTSYGYRVLLAGDGAEAVALLAEQQSKVQVVLTDLGLPTLPGAALIRTLRRIAPRAKIIAQIDTEATPDKRSSSQAERLGDQRLYKPFTAHQLLMTLAELLKTENPGR